MLVSFAREDSQEDHRRGLRGVAAKGAAWHRRRHQRDRAPRPRARRRKSDLREASKAPRQGASESLPRGTSHRPRLIAVDSSAWIAWFSNESGSDVELVDRALADRLVCLPPVVPAELLSDPKLPPRVRTLLAELPLLAATEGYWERAGFLRARLQAARRKAPLADTFIAQSCLDDDVQLIVRDLDYLHYAKVARLKLLS